MLVVGTTKRPAHPVGEFIRAQQSIELHDLALAMNPFGLDGVQPRTLLWQKATDDPHTTAALLYFSVVFSEPSPHLPGDVPACVVPDQKKGFLANSFELLTAPREKPRGYGAHGPAVDELYPHIVEPWKVESIAGYSAEQVKVFLETACGDRLEALFVLAIHTGLRQGELLGLKWEDVDLESGTLRVRRTLATTKSGPMLTAPKTKGSRRSVKLTQGTLDALRSHLKRQLQEIRAGSLWRENGLVFASETREPLDRRYLTSRRFKGLLESAGLPEIRFHDLRHTCATLLLSKNVNPKIVSEMLGHATIAITLDTYSHIIPNMRDQAAAAMEEALS
jgi:integrase